MLISYSYIESYIESYRNNRYLLTTNYMCMQVKAICISAGENVEVHRYKRLTNLEIENEALGSLINVKPGDCIVCFSKNDIFTVSRSLESRGTEVAVIYGSLPPGTKLAQAAKFNDPKNSCKVLVATNAIGMGLNL